MYMERQYLDNCPDEKPKVSQFGAAKSSSLSKTYKNRGRRMNGPFGLRYYAIVYAINSPDHGLIKFGRTTNIQKRFAGICTMSPAPLELMGHVWLPDDAEAYIHDFLKEDRAHGEWFRKTERTRSIAALIAAQKVRELAEITEMTWMLTEDIPSGVAWGVTDFR